VSGITIFADELDQFGIEHNSLIDADGPGFRVGFRIVDGDVDFQCSIAWAAEAFNGSTNRC